MEIRHTKPEDLPAILALYEKATAFMRKNGNPAQWAEGDSPLGKAAADIAGERSYVCCEDAALLAVFVFEPETDEAAYRTVRDGAWPDDGPYGVLHRIAVGVPGRDVAGYCFDWCAARCRQLRADTHADNVPMQRAFAKNGFIRAGIVTLEDGTDRIAYYRPADITLHQDEKRRGTRLWLCAGLYGAAMLLALALIYDLLRAMGASLLWLLLFAAVMALPGVLRILPRLGKGGRITAGPAGIDTRLAEPALHGTWPWSDFTAAAFTRGERALELTPRDPDAFWDKLPKRTRRALRQRRVKNDTFPLPCLLLTKSDRQRLGRLADIYLKMNAEKRDAEAEKGEKQCWKSE